MRYNSTMRSRTHALGFPNQTLERSVNYVLALITRMQTLTVYNINNKAAKKVPWKRMNPSR